MGSVWPWAVTFTGFNTIIVCFPTQPHLLYRTHPTIHIGNSTTAAKATRSDARTLGDLGRSVFSRMTAVFLDDLNYSHLIDEVQQRLRRVKPHQPDAPLARVVENLGILVEVEAPRLVPFRLHLQSLQIAVVENVPVQRSLQRQDASIQSRTPNDNQEH